MNMRHFREYVIFPTLEHLAGDDMPWIATKAAANLLLGTAMAESRLVWLVQHNGGPARGVYQIEPATADWLMRDYLPNRQGVLFERVCALKTDVTSLESELCWNLALATAIARARFVPVPEPLPDADDWLGLAGYWKRFYNTSAGMGTEEHFMRAVSVVT